LKFSTDALNIDFLCELARVGDFN